MRIFLYLLTSTFLFSAAARAELPESLRREGEDAVRKGMQWLLSQQKEAGFWSSPEWPALTALPVWSLSLSEQYRDNEAVDKGLVYLASHAHDSGAIYVEPKLQFKGGGKSNYNTGISMVALHLSGREKYRPLVLKARTFMAGGQHLGGDVYHGGFGYDSKTKRPYADLSNHYMAMEAMAITEDAEDFRTEGEKVSVDKKAAAEFASKVQNRKESNDLPGVSDHPDDAGGFAYNPVSSFAGTRELEDGRKALRSFGSMTYAGMLSLIYADVERGDPRVKSAFDWAGRHWTLNENPGMGQQGLYYFYNVMSKALAVYGQEEIEGPNGPVNWREEFVRKLVSLQRIDEDGRGYWVNDENRFWEGDKVLVTSYALIALQVALNED